MASVFLGWPSCPFCKFALKPRPPVHCSGERKTSQNYLQDEDRHLATADEQAGHTIRHCVLSNQHQENPHPKGNQPRVPTQNWNQNLRTFEDFHGPNPANFEDSSYTTLSQKGKSIKRILIWLRNNQAILTRASSRVPTFHSHSTIRMYSAIEFSQNICVGENSFEFEDGRTDTTAPLNFSGVLQDKQRRNPIGIRLNSKCSLDIIRITIVFWTPGFLRTLSASPWPGCFRNHTAHTVINRAKLCYAITRADSPPSLAIAVSEA
ncbi:hypothetical protein GQR58_027264 [Nymphon striatum]|nr:hypothetical protein GQR58_027264 [Nymphon striatum]